MRTRTEWVSFPEWSVGNTALYQIGGTDNPVLALALASMDLRPPSKMESWDIRHTGQGRI